MDSAQWQQGIGIGVVRAAAADQNPIRPTEKKPRPEQVVNCPRCNSTNTKFCYYNNYSLSQPRYFCKTCRRYWTEGGTLRNVPVGGGSRRKHRPSSSKTDPTPPKIPPDQNPKIPPYNNNINPPIYNGTLVSLPFYPQNPNFSFMDLLKTTTEIPPPNSVFDSTTVFPSGLHEIKPTSSFSLDRIDNGFGTVQVQDHHTSSRTGFPFEEPKPVEIERGLPLDSNGYWNGLLPGTGSGGSW